MVLGAALFFLGCFCDVATGARHPPSMARLAPQFEQTYPITDGQAHSFVMDLWPGDLLYLVLQQEGVDIALSLLDPKGQELVYVDGPNGPEGPEFLLAQAKVEGVHRLLVHATHSGTYHLSVASMGTPSPEEAALLETLELMEQAVASTQSREDHRFEKARELLQEAQQRMPASTPPLIQARLRQQLGETLDAQGDLSGAATALERANRLLEHHGNAWEQGSLLNTLGNIYVRMGKFDAAFQAFQDSLECFRSVKHLAGRAVAWNNLGVAWASRGEMSEALLAYHRALKLWRELGWTAHQADLAHNLGTYHLSMGRHREGLEDLRQALQLRQRTGDPLKHGHTLSSLAWGLTQTGEYDEALDAYGRSLSLLRQAQAPYDEALVLEQRATLLIQVGRAREASRDLKRSLRLLADAPLHEAYVRLGLGTAALQLDQPVIARRNLEPALRTFDDLNVRHGMIWAHHKLAQAWRLEGQIDRAAIELRAAIQQIEAVRRALSLPTFRQSYLGTHQDVYGELVDLLMESTITAAPELAEERLVRAFDVGEQARGRSLRESLADARSRFRMQQVSDELENRQKELLAQIEILEQHRLQALQRRSPTRFFEVKLAGLWQDLERVREAIRQQGGYRPPKAETIPLPTLRNHLDDDTLLLTYSLGAERSWLWIVHKDSLHAVELGPRQDIERQARRLHQLLPRSGDKGYGTGTRQALEALSHLVLEPAAQYLDRSRIVVVGDGLLHYIPFGVLPVPGSNGKALLQTAEVVHLPSASSLVHIRRRTDARLPAEHLIAIVTDPVFERIDSRFAPPLEARGAEPLGGRFRRLPGTAVESRQILDLVPEEETPFLATGFEAKRELLLGGELAYYRILHIATHGVTNFQKPELSGLILSLLDREGRPQHGMVHYHELFDLHLPADLVVLSACRTALGEEIRGEGLVGLTQGFFAAGAARLLVSFWDVDDHATAALMHHFYRGLLHHQLSPAEALRQAQVRVASTEGWEAPAFWAGFSLVGDWRPLERGLTARPSAK